MFFIVDFLACQTLGIIGSQIEIEFFSALVRIITKLKCCLQSGNLKRFIFVNKNWPNDLRIDYKPLFNLVELIEKD